MKRSNLLPPSKLDFLLFGYNMLIKGDRLVLCGLNLFQPISFLSLTIFYNLPCKKYISLLFQWFRLLGVRPESAEQEHMYSVRPSCIFFFARIGISSNGIVILMLLSRRDALVCWIELIKHMHSCRGFEKFCTLYNIVLY